MEETLFYNNKHKLPDFGVNNIKHVKIEDENNLKKIWEHWYNNESNKDYLTNHIILLTDERFNVIPYGLILEQNFQCAQPQYGSPEIIINKIFCLKNKLSDIFYDVNINKINENENSKCCCYNKVYYIEDKDSNMYRYEESFKEKNLATIIEYIVYNYDTICDNILKKSIMLETVNIVKSGNEYLYISELMHEVCGKCLLKKK